MRLSFRLITFICCVLLLSACNRMPDHARYIPKDAVIVVGINAKALGKKVAWNVITGSKLFKEMQKHMPDKNAKDAMDGLEQAGIDAMNTFYVYIKGDKRFKNGNRVTALVPLTDAGQWEAYVKKTFPSATIKQQGKRKEAQLTGSVYAGWTNNLLIIMNMLPSADSYYPNGDNGMDSTATPVAQSKAMDETTIEAEMENAFNVSDENSLKENKRFAKLETAGHDVTVWMNYDELMTEYVSKQMASMMGGFSLSNTLWKDAAFAGGIDFSKGRITEDMRIYTSDDLKDICKELGATNADKDMIDKLPAQNLDMLMAWHLSQKGLKALLDKMGLLGFANIALSSQGINADYIFDAFTGDMAVSLNEFSLKKVAATTTVVYDSGMNNTSQISELKPTVNALFVIKINKKENFNKLLQMATDNGLAKTGSNMYAMPTSENDSIFIMTNDKYAVISNKQANVAGYINGTYKNQKLPDGVSSTVYGHPFSMFLDAQEIAKMIDANIGGTPDDSLAIAEGKKLLSNVSASGGAFRDGAFEYKVSVNFMNKDENSLLELMDFGMRINKM